MKKLFGWLCLLAVLAVVPVSIGCSGGGTTKAAESTVKVGTPNTPSTTATVTVTK